MMRPRSGHTRTSVAKAWVAKAWVAKCCTAPGGGAAPGEGIGGGRCPLPIRPGIAPALVQFSMPVDHTSVSASTLPLAINARSCSSEYGPSCRPLFAMYHFRSAMIAPDYQVRPAKRPLRLVAQASVAVRRFSPVGEAKVGNAPSDLVGGAT